MCFEDNLVLKTHFKPERMYFSSYSFHLEMYKMKSGKLEWLRCPRDIIFLIFKNLL